MNPKEAMTQHTTRSRVWRTIASLTIITAGIGISAGAVSATCANGAPDWPTCTPPPSTTVAESTTTTTEPEATTTTTTPEQAPTTTLPESTTTTELVTVIVLDCDVDLVLVGGECVPVDTTTPVVAIADPPVPSIAPRMINGPGTNVPPPSTTVCAPPLLTAEDFTCVGPDFYDTFPTSATDPALPATGASRTDMGIGFGLVAICAGIGLVMIARRRHV